MATIPSIDIPNADASDALAAMEKVWLSDTIKRIGQAAYDALTGPRKARELIITEIRVRTRNYRREQAERAILIPDVDVN